MGLKDRSLFSSNKRLEAKIKVSAGMLSSEPLSWLVGGHLLPLSSHSFPSGCCFHLFLLIMTTCMQVLSRFSCVRLLAMPWTVAHQAPLSLGFSRQEYQSGLLFPSPGDLSDPRIKPASPVLWADSLPLSHQGSPSFTKVRTDFLAHNYYFFKVMKVLRSL